ncbi:hypothetical protein OF83DRAFT_1129926 [Amylostereum chailletii]|nr:hypothetical protein OF83DRAFT_1129926 [Amylostereum chailletii]
MDPRAPDTYEVEVKDKAGHTAKRLKRNAQSAWRRKVGRCVAAIMFGRRNRQKQPVWEIAAWPAGYTFWVTPKVKIEKDGTLGERKDHYLYGSPAATFESPHEFAYHAVWLMRGMPVTPYGRPDCRCQYCAGGKQKPITAELKAIVSACDGEGRIGDGPQDPAYDVVDDEDEDDDEDEEDEDASDAEDGTNDDAMSLED